MSCRWLSLGVFLLAGCYDPPLAIQLDPKEAVLKPVPGATPIVCSQPSASPTPATTPAPSTSPTPAPTPTSKTSLAGIKSIEVSPNAHAGEVTTITVVGQESSTCYRFDSIRVDEDADEIRVTLLNQDHTSRDWACGPHIRYYTVQAVFTVGSPGMYRIIGNGRDFGTIEVK